jgi:hypothetical protein
MYAKNAVEAQRAKNVNWAKSHTDEARANIQAGRAETARVRAGMTRSQSQSQVQSQAQSGGQSQSRNMGS